MSYSPVSGICLLASQPCVLAEKHDEFMLMVFRDLEHVDCAVWVQDMVGAVPDRILTTINDGHVGRVTSGGNTGSGNIPVDILVGQANRPGQNWKTYIAHTGQAMEFPNEELLTVHPNCTMAWVPHKAGDVLPVNAIATGMLANGRRLYSTLSYNNAVFQWIVGVYAEGDNAAHYAYTGSVAVTQFDILVSV